MTHDEVKELILREKLIIIVRKVPSDKMGDLAKALVEGGIKLLEITFDQQASDPAGDYAECTRAVRQAVGDKLILGAGTVLNPSQVEAAYTAGAEYIIAPNTDEAVIKKTKELGMVSIPGAMTPSEVCSAWNMGADMVKLFPADDLGYHYIKSLRAPLPHIPLLATGGATIETIPHFLRSGASGCGTSSSILNRQMLANDDYEGITRLARAHVEAVKSVEMQ